MLQSKKGRKEGGGGGGGGVGDRLQSPVETHVLLLFFTVHRGGGGVIVHIVCFIEWNPKGRCNRMVFQWARRVVWLNGFDQGISVN